MAVRDRSPPARRAAPPRARRAARAAATRDDPDRADRRDARARRGDRGRRARRGRRRDGGAAGRPARRDPRPRPRRTLLRGNRRRAGDLAARRPPARLARPRRAARPPPGCPMTDFVDLLEDQLVAAHRRRARARPVRLPSRRAAAALVACLATAGALAAAIVGLAGPQGARPARPAATSAPPGHGATATVPAAPQAKTVAVLNATATPGAARAPAARLVEAGYRPVEVANAPSVRRRSAVMYAPHAGTRAILTAVAIARRERIARVVPLTAALRRVAGGDADVVVLLGTDRAGHRP